MDLVPNEISSAQLDYLFSFQEGAHCLILEVDLFIIYYLFLDHYHCYFFIEDVGWRAGGRLEVPSAAKATSRPGLKSNAII